MDSVSDFKNNYLKGFSSYVKFGQGVIAGGGEKAWEDIKSLGNAITNPEEIVTALLKLVSSPEAVAKIGVEEYNKIVNKFTNVQDALVGDQAYQGKMATDAGKNLGELVLMIGETYGGIKGLTAISKVEMAGAKAVAEGVLDAKPSPGTLLRKEGEYYIKTVDPEASRIAQWYAKSQLDAQVEGLNKLGDMAPLFSYENGILRIKDAGKYDGKDFWKIWLEGSKRLGTPMNDIRARNIGANGIIFDPSLDILGRSIMWAGTIGGPPLVGIIINSWINEDKK